MSVPRWPLLFSFTQLVNLNYPSFYSDRNVLFLAGEVKIGRVQDVSLNKSPAAHLEVEECTGLLKSDNLAKGDVHVKKANIVYSHDTCTSKVGVQDCLVGRDGEVPQMTTSPQSTLVYGRTWHPVQVLRTGPYFA